MIQETELNLLVPSSELLITMASGDKSFGIKVGPPHIRHLRETYFDTPEGALRRRRMTCKLKQGEGESPSVVVTVGEGPDSEGITSRSRLTASAVGYGVFETLRGETEPGMQIRKFVDPTQLRPSIALDIQRLGRTYRSRVARLPVLSFYFDRITVQSGGTSSVLHEIRIRRRRSGGPQIRELAQLLRDEFHLFPDGMSTLQRAHRLLALGKDTPTSEPSPYALSLVLAAFNEGAFGLVPKGNEFHIPSFRGSGEDAARALAADLLGTDDIQLLRLGSTSLREERPIMELWAAPEPPLSLEKSDLVWYPWYRLLERAGSPGLKDPNLLSALLLLSRKRLLGQLDWVPGFREQASLPEPHLPQPSPAEEKSEPEQIATEKLLPLLRAVETPTSSLEDRLTAISELSDSLREIFQTHVRELKGQILSEDTPANDPLPVRRLDLLSVRVRGILERTYEVVTGEILPALEAKNIHFRDWSGLMYEDRRAILEVFAEEFFPAMRLVADWGPAFIPEMPAAGSALGLTVRTQGSESIRFFHLVLAPETPLFYQIPDSYVILPLEEMVRGFLYDRFPELEQAETHLFRFRTAEVTVMEEVPPPDPDPEEEMEEDPDDDVRVDETDESGPGVGDIEDTTTEAEEESPEPMEVEGEPEDIPIEPALPAFREAKHSVVVRITTNNSMPMSHQTQLLRALERQVARESPLIGWADVYTVPSPMDPASLAELLKEG